MGSLRKTGSREVNELSVRRPGRGRKGAAAAYVFLVVSQMKPLGSGSDEREADLRPLPLAGYRTQR